MLRRNSTPLVALVLVAGLVLFLYSSNAGRETWQRLPQHVGLGEHLGASHAPANASTAAQDPHYQQWNPRLDFKPGSPMPPGHNYTSLLVVAKTKDEKIDWMHSLLPDQPKAVYVADDPKAPLHPPANKGHEVMVYLTWIIDNYDNLPDVTMFMHAHQFTWHNDELLGNDAARMVQRLSRQRVWREGYVNMRCSWRPGCPDWMHPGETEKNDFKPEEILLAKSWTELFPLDEVPSVLAQPCCAQFALSRERIHAKPLAQYVWYRDWLFNTQLPDSLSGRIWEYIWQFVFTASNIFCPKEHICFCDQFGLCYGGEELYADFLSLRHEMADREGDLRQWEQQRKAIEKAEKEGKHALLDILPKPQEGRDKELRAEIDRLRLKVEKLQKDAEERGNHPRNRALEAGRDWREGDDF
ncbi:hypothetical protein ACEQ8H_006167 [Pleosporales sp. CAS-2024a]